MIKNYLKIAWRNLIKNKGYSAINIGGLAVGMAVAILIGLWMYDELSFNKYHQHYDRIGRLLIRVTVNGETKTGRYQPLPIGPELRKSFSSDFKHVVVSTFSEEHSFAWGDKKLTQAGYFMEEDAPEMLSLKMLKGTSNGLKDPYSILLSASFAKILFGNENPLNKVIKIDTKSDVKVTGIYEDIPLNSEFSTMAFLAPWDLYLKQNSWMQYFKDDWGNNMVQVFTEIIPTTDFDNVSAKIKDVLLKHSSEMEASFKPAYFIHPMSKWHLYGQFKNGVNTGGLAEFVWLFGIIGIFVLLLACINFMNLSTARSEKRAKEVGIRKAVGSVRSQIVYQFLTESVLVVVLAFAFAMFLVQISLPLFNQIADKKMELLWTIPPFWFACIGFCLFTSLLAGSYPALYLSSFQPIKVLKGTFKAGRFASLPRKVMVVVQFTVSVVLIIGTIMVFRQIQFTKSRPVGYSRDGLISFGIKTNDIHNHLTAFRSDLLNTGAIIDVAESNGAVTDISENTGSFQWQGKDPNFRESFGHIRVSPGYGKTVNWQIIDGRDFSENNISDSLGLVLNESAAKMIGFKNPVGEIIKYDDKDFKIIGIAKDMVMKSPYEPARPSVFSLLPWRGETVLIKLNPEKDAGNSLAKIETVFNKYVPDMAFDYKFADIEYAKKFNDESRIGNLSAIFAIIAILISCLGLFGLASFVAEQRTKEIGIRKVIGASVLNLWQMLSRDFVVLVIISCVIAIPIAYYFMSEWLQKYQYRTTVSWWIFAVAIAGALLITLLTVSFQAIKAAMANPIKSLRTE